MTPATMSLFMDPPRIEKMLSDFAPRRVVQRVDSFASEEVWPSRSSARRCHEAVRSQSVPRHPESGSPRSAMGIIFRPPGWSIVNQRTGARRSRPPAVRRCVRARASPSSTSTTGHQAARRAALAYHGLAKCRGRGIGPLISVVTEPLGASRPRPPLTGPRRSPSAGSRAARRRARAGRRCARRGASGLP